MVNVGKWAFIAGLVIAVISGFWEVPAVALVMVVLGLIVGFLNISGKEAPAFLLANVALLIVGMSGNQVVAVLGELVGLWLGSVLTNFVAFVAASALVVAVKVVLALGGTQES